jgi:large subunit ribosomal protein L17
MLSNMASSLIIHKRINTTLAKAKALRKYVEPLITRAKENTTQNRRVVFSYLQNKESVHELFTTVADKTAARPGGYTRILKLGARLGDNADMCIMELVDFNELLLEEAKPKKSRRSRRGGKGKASKEETSQVASEEETKPAESKEETVDDEAKAETTDETVEATKVETADEIIEATEEETTSEEAKTEAQAEGQSDAASEEKSEETDSDKEDQKDKNKD